MTSAYHYAIVTTSKVGNDFTYDCFVLFCLFFVVVFFALLTCVVVSWLLYSIQEHSLSVIFNTI